MTGKIGIALITCNALSKFEQSSKTIPSYFRKDNFVVVNDGMPYDTVYPENAFLIQHNKNYGVAKSKNDALNYLIINGCEHIFLMEDDILIKDESVFNKYIRASQASGIYHFNYALQGPFNRKQSLYKNKTFIDKSKILANKFSNRIIKRPIFDGVINSLPYLEQIALLDENSEPNPKLTINYNHLNSIAFYEKCVGSFSYYRKEIIDKIGFFDEHFINAGEHIEHTYRISKTNSHPSFRWFPDIADSYKYIDNIVDCMKSSTISTMENREINIDNANKYFKKKYYMSFSKTPNISKKEFIYQSNRILKNRDIDNLEILIKFPTRNRPDKFFETLDKYICMLEDKVNYKIIVSCDNDDLSMNNPEVINKLESYKNLTYFFQENKNKIEAVNANISNKDDFDILLLASDDMIPQIDGYDNIIRKNFLKYFPDLDGVLWFNDGYRGKELNTLCILGKKYFDRFNYIYHRSYISLWCDNEFTEVANRLNKQVYINEIIIKHEHPANLDMIEFYDDLMKKNQSFDSLDKINFKKRKKKKFL